MTDFKFRPNLSRNFLAAQFDATRERVEDEAVFTGETFIHEGFHRLGLGIQNLMIQARKISLPKGRTVKNDMKHPSRMSRGATVSAENIFKFNIPAWLGMDLGSTPSTFKVVFIHAIESLRPPDLLFLLLYFLDSQVKVLFLEDWFRSLQKQTVTLFHE